MYQLYGLCCWQAACAGDLELCQAEPFRGDSGSGPKAPSVGPKDSWAYDETWFRVQGLGVRA